MKVLVVDMTGGVRGALWERLAADTELDTVGVVRTRVRTLDLCDKLRPDMVLLFFDVPQAAGWDLLETLRRKDKTARLAALMPGMGPRLRNRCLEAGADVALDADGGPNHLLAEVASWMPPHAINEPQRLRELHRLRILDTPPEEGFDRAAVAAARIVNASISLISLVDASRQWFKARVGVETQESPRIGGFCAHAILSQGLFEVSDAQNDSRFGKNPFVHGRARIRHYAGVPLVLSSGAVIGTLCVMARTPRKLSGWERTALESIAHALTMTLEEKQHVARLQEKLDSESRMTHATLHDPLTGLLNRAALIAQMEQSLNAASEAGKMLGLLLIDLDGFKAVNAVFGHAVGDVMLQTVALRLAQEVRATDAVARVSGDEFGVLLAGLTRIDHAERVAKKVIAALSRPLEYQGQNVEIGCSVGLAVFPYHADSHFGLLRHAGMALCHAKKVCGSRLKSFTEGMASEASERMALESELRIGIESGQLELHYQPQIGLRNHTLVGFEALARWRHPRLGLLPPNRFIPLAEDTGMIRNLGLTVLYLALGQVAEWERQGLKVPSVSVNVSPSQLDENFPNVLDAILSHHHVSPKRLLIELTENALAPNVPVFNGVLNAIRGLGIGIAVDDFGVGYSSLALLRRTPITLLKIDRSFVTELFSTPRDTAIVGAMLAMAESLGLQTVAEGVETYEQHLALRDLGCEQGQGYLYSRPVGALVAAGWLKGTASGVGFGALKGLSGPTTTKAESPSHGVPR